MKHIPPYHIAACTLLCTHSKIEEFNTQFDLLVLHILVLSWIKPNQGQKTSPWAWHCWTPLNFRYSGELAKEDLIYRADNKKDDDRLTGASIFPTDLDLTQNSQHHPWACSLRTRGYRGRHRCGVTLLYGNNKKSSRKIYLKRLHIQGPRKDKSETHDDPYVLVSAAHCNYICKDRISGDVLETCCCRPPNTEGSCAPNSGESVNSNWFKHSFSSFVIFSMFSRVPSARVNLCSPWLSLKMWLLFVENLTLVLKSWKNPGNPSNSSLLQKLSSIQTTNLPRWGDISHSCQAQDKVQKITNQALWKVLRSCSSQVL